MDKKRVLLISPPNLLRDSLEHLLSHLEDVQVSGTWPLDSQVLAHCSEQPHDLVLIADDESTAEQVSAVVSTLLEANLNMPIIRVKLDTKILLVYNAQALPARVAELIKVIRQTPLSGI
jgi:hypothetical protein